MTRIRRRLFFLILICLLYNLLITLGRSHNQTSVVVVEPVASHIQHGEPLLKSWSASDISIGSSGHSFNLKFWDQLKGFFGQSLGSEPNNPFPGMAIGWYMKMSTKKAELDAEPSKLPHTQPLKFQDSVKQRVTKSTVLLDITSPSPVNPGLHIVSVFPLLLTETWKKQGYNNTDGDLLRKREEEYVYCLRHNLQVNSVSKVHLFTDQPTILNEKLSSEYRLNLDKAQIHKSSSNPTYRDIFQYASEVLQHNLVFVMNADNFLGEGFDEIDFAWWRDNATSVYALTRHSSPNASVECKMGPLGYCDPTGGLYYGSHDGFLFYLNSSLPDAFLSQLEFPSHVYGSENVIIWAFRKFLNFSVANPCRHLVIYHNHCAGVRASNQHRQRVQNVGPMGLANFTDW